LILSLADTHGIAKYARTYMELPNTHAHTYEDTRTHTGKKKVEIVKKREKGGKKGGGVRGK